MLMTGFVLLIAANLVLAVAGGLGGAMLGVVLWGLHMGFTQGLLATPIADTAPPDKCGGNPALGAGPRICYPDLCPRPQHASTACATFLLVSGRSDSFPC